MVSSQTWPTQHSVTEFHLGRNPLFGLRGLTFLACLSLFATGVAASQDPIGNRTDTLVEQRGQAPLNGELSEIVPGPLPLLSTPAATEVPAWQPATTAEPYEFSEAGSGRRPGFEWLGEGPWREPVLALLGLHEPLFMGGYYDPLSTQQFAYGCLGTTPYRLGWYSYQDVVYVPSSDTHGVSGEFEMVEWNSWIRYSTMLDERHLLTWTGIWNSRFWSGPTGLALPPDAGMLGSDFQFASASAEQWNWQAGVTPQINSDFERQLTSHAYMVDARVVVLNKVSPHLTVAIGAAFWDRARDHYIPYGGVVWTPDDRWELRATFPKSRISYFVGNHFESDIWVYGTGEYTIDAYQIDLEDDTRIKDRAEFRDYRLLVGINAQRPRGSVFSEGGYITNRQVDFRGSTPDFDISDSWIVRAGIAY